MRRSVCGRRAIAHTAAMSAAEADPFAGSYPEPRVVGLGAPFRWVAAGWADLRRAWPCSLFYGVTLAGMGWVLVHYLAAGPVALALLTGFLLVGPLVATGLYALSRSLEHGERCAFVASLTAWRVNLTSFSFFGAILALLLAVWIRVSVVVVALFFDGPMPHLATLVADLLAAPEGVWFLLAYAAAGFGFAALVFSVSVVSLPMLLDRPRCDTMTAVITSARVLLANRGPLLVWAAIIVALTAAGFATASIGLALTLPLIGHATWHAYRALVCAEVAAAT